MKYLVACSAGNDSIALIQFMLENYPKEFGVVYNNTGWAKDGWSDRVEKLFKQLEEIGVKTFETASVGMEALVKGKKGWPMPASKMQFCTKFLKEDPTLNLLQEIDPDRDIIVVTGRRREESNNRKHLPLHQIESQKHGNRDVFNPLINYLVEDRDILIHSLGWEVLPHQSRECYPCVCSNKKDLLAMSEDTKTINKVKAIELSLGHTRKGKPRVMFRPYRVGGSIGIDEVINWSKKRGYKSTEVPEDYQIPGVDYSGFIVNMNSDERAVFWKDIQEQAEHLGYDMTDLVDMTQQDKVYEDTTREGIEFVRQCDGGYCGE